MKVSFLDNPVIYKTDICVILSSIVMIYYIRKKSTEKNEE